MLPLHTHNRCMQQVGPTRQHHSCIPPSAPRRKQYRPFTGPTRRLVAAVAASQEAAQQDPELLKQIMNYVYEVESPDGQLVINVLRSELLPKAADLLTDTFVDTKGIQAYRRYVRRNIHTYLEQHFKMPPAAVVLTAVLRTQVPADAVDALMLQEFQEAAAAADKLPPLISNSSIGSSSSSSTPEPSDVAVNPNSTTDSSSILAQCNSAQQDQQEVDHDHNNSSVSSSSSSRSSQQASSQQGLTSMVQSVLHHLSSGLGIQQQQQQQQQQFKTVEHLVGVAEVSFKDFTRSSYLTLNPPKKCAYLCNMAVGSDWRRRGIASHLITAVEDLCCLAGEVDMYLHLRLKDSDSAGGLYQKAGFATHKKDWPIIILLGQDPRYLMKKQLAANRSLVGRVNLPAELQQQVAESGGVLEESSSSGTVQQQQQQQQGAAVRRVAPAASPAA